MESAAGVVTLAPSIKCSTCDMSVSMHLLADHTCSQVTNPQMVGEPAQIQPMHGLPAIRSRKSSRPPLPKLDLFAPARSPTHGELTPVSSGPGSGTASPMSSGRRSPWLHPPRKTTPVRRPPSPELLSQDCAFPPFPTNKTKKKDSSKNAKDRTKMGETTSSKPFDQQRSRSASIGAPRSRSRHGTADSSRPSTANSSRQASLSSRAGSRQGSIDVPPLPALQQTSSQTASDAGSWNTEPVHIQNPSLDIEKVYSPASSNIEVSVIPNKQVEASSAIDSSLVSESSINPYHSTQPLNESQQREPLYRAKRPPPIPNLLSNDLEHSSIPKPEPSPSASHAPPPHSNTLSRTLTSLFGRKRNTSTSSKKNLSKAPVTDGLRLVALSPDPDPQETPILGASGHSSFDNDANIAQSLKDFQGAPGVSVDIQSAHDIPEPLHAEISQPDDASEYSDSDDGERESQDLQSRDDQRDTMRLEKDLEQRLAAMGTVPRLSVVDETSEEIKRASADSASSYGSVGFSHSSVSSRSFRGFEGHSQGSSISTARTASSIDELLLFPKPRNTVTTPDSPTDPHIAQSGLQPVLEPASSQEATASEIDPYLQNNRLSTVHEALSSPEEERPQPITSERRSGMTSSDSEPDSYGFPLPPTNATAVPQTSLSPGDASLSPLNERQRRRPSTPGAFRGMCRGCSKPIVGGQKSVSSKDGQLSGRYHKECFTCMTCREPFATADFYVHDDYPYCAQHYHEINGTLCEGCGKGIEGHYLESSNIARTGAKKYHPDCLQCATCKMQLDEDYFELAGRVYCERDAFRVANGPRSPYGTLPSRPSPLNREYINSTEPTLALQSGRFPERRLTKLMTTF